MWRDELLTWNPALYGGIKHFIVTQDYIWKPDIAIYNSICDFYLSSSVVNVFINNQGLILWEPPVILELSCKVDVSKYPYDKNTCDIKMISWMYDVAAINITTGKEPIIMDRFVPNKVFIVSSGGVECRYYRHFKKYYKYLLFKITLARRAMYPTMTIVVPIIMLAILNILSFLIALGDKDKLSVAFTTLLASTVFLSIVDNELPDNSSEISLLIVYISLLILISIFTIAGHCVTIAVHDMDLKAAKVSPDSIGGSKPVATFKWWNILTSGSRAWGLNALFLIFNIIFFVVVTCVVSFYLFA
ncbi:neuronal acetylcholine receptor subunit alpha-6-like [Physella acuta]|uniref:neuronal acetylcholine receptor subunit alpha-6-like n=1 Tax=Physella acuta TaxID=109671 RepID=UPI0027DE9D85|nr:neuronal acetylcholine receptor subunit alpha-6-like [Physella acuta]